MGTEVHQEGEGSFSFGEHAVAARVGVFGEKKQPVVYLSIGHDRKLILGYDTLCGIIDMLCGKKESLEQKMLAKMDDITVGMPRRGKS